MINYQRLFVPHLINSILLCIVFHINLINSLKTTVITYQYYLPSSNYSNISQNAQTDGVISLNGNQIIVQNGRAFTLRDSTGKSDGCPQPVDNSNYSNSVAIIQWDGNCTLSVKITRAKQCGTTGNLYQSIKMYKVIY